MDKSAGTVSPNDASDNGRSFEASFELPDSEYSLYDGVTDFNKKIVLFYKRKGSNEYIPFGKSLFTTVSTERFKINMNHEDAANDDALSVGENMSVLEDYDFRAVFLNGEGQSISCSTRDFKAKVPTVGCSERYKSDYDLNTGEDNSLCWKEPVCDSANHYYLNDTITPYACIYCRKDQGGDIINGKCVYKPYNIVETNFDIEDDKAKCTSIDYFTSGIPTETRSGCSKKTWMCNSGGGSVFTTCHSYTCRRGDPYSVEDYNKTEYEDVTPSCN